MPHILIEYAADAIPTSNAVEAFLETMVSASSNAEAITPANVKMRAQRYEHVRVAGETAPFIHLTVSLMEGPSDDALGELADLLFDAATGSCPEVAQITVDIRTMVPATYRKRGQNGRGIVSP